MDRGGPDHRGPWPRIIGGGRPETAERPRAESFSRKADRPPIGTDGHAAIARAEPANPCGGARSQSPGGARRIAAAYRHAGLAAYADEGTSRAADPGVLR